MQLRRHLSLAALAALAACSSPSPAPPSAAPPTSASEPPTSEPPSSAPPSSAPGATGTSSTGATPATEDAPPRALTAEERRQLSTAIREGRRAAHSGDFTAALASFERAVAVQPTSSRVRCEAAYVAYQAGDLDRAEAHVRIAVLGLPRGDAVPESARVPTATCLYNAGLVDEARGRLEDARASYARSIALRPNDTVEGRLAALLTRIEGSVPPPDGPPDFGPYAPSTTFAAVASDVTRALCQRGGIGFEAGEMDCGELSHRVETVRTSGEHPIEAALISVSASTPAGGEEAWSVLVVRSGSETQVVELAAVYSPGAFGMSAEIDATIAASDLVPGAGTELLVTLSARAHDSDMGVCDYYETDESASIVCSTDDGTLRCAAFPTVSTDTYTHEPCQDSFDADHDDDYDEPLEGDEANIEEHGYEVSVALNAGQATFARAPGSHGEEVPPLLGSFEVAALLTRADLAWPATWVTLSPVTS